MSCPTYHSDTFATFRNITEPFTEVYTPDPVYIGTKRSLSDPAYYLDMPNSVRCGRGNMDHAADTEVLKVQAGDTIEFVTASLGYSQLEDARFWNDCLEGRGFCSLWSEAGQYVSAFFLSSSLLSVRWGGMSAAM